MKPSLIILFFLLASAGADPAARKAMRAGFDAYKAGDFSAAAAAWERAQDTYPHQAAYNRGLAHAQMQAFEEALEAFEQALGSERLAWQASSYYNAATLHLHQADACIQNHQLEPALAHLEEALDYYEQTLLLSPASRDAKENYEHTFTRFLDLYIRRAQAAFSQGEEALAAGRAKQAKSDYLRAQTYLDELRTQTRILPPQVASLTEQIAARMHQLETAVAQAEQALQRALGYIHLYDYLPAQALLSDTSTQRAYALDLRADLKERFNSMREKNEQILQIEQTLNPEVTR